jgi:DNA-binding CsgD family transcriptional regulator
MFMFGEEVAAAAASVRTGINVQLRTTYPGVGLTTALDALEVLLVDAGHSVIRFRDSLGGNSDYFALQMAGFASVAQRVPRPDGSISDELSAALAGSTRGIVMIDDLLAIDASSTRLIQVAVNRTKCSVVEGRTRDYLHLRRAGVDWLPAPGVTITLDALGYIPTTSLLREALGGPIASDVASRVFAKSGGITGLALAIVRGAKDAGKIIRREGRWELAATDLWSSAVDAWFEVALTRVSVEHLDVLFRAGPSTVLDDSVVESLVDAGFLRRSHQAPYELIPSPPALETYLRRRRDSAVAEGNPPSEAPRRRDAMDIARTVRSVRQRAETRAIDRRAEWSAAPSPTSAVPYLETLFALSRGASAIHEVLARTPLTLDASPGDAFDLVIYGVVSRAHDADERAGEVVVELVNAHPEWKRAFRALDRFLRSGILVEEDVAAARESAEVDPGAAFLVSLDAYMSVAAGRSSRALRDLRSPSYPLRAVTRLRSFVETLEPLVRGRVGDAARRSDSELQRAVEDADYPGIMLHSYVRALAQLFEGDLDEALGTLERALAFGRPGWGSVPVYRGLLHLIAFVKASTGSPRAAHAYLTAAARIEAATSPLPVLQVGVADAIRAFADGDLPGAAEMCRAVAEEAAGEGALFAAVALLEFSLGVQPEEATLDALRRLRVHPSGRSLATPAWIRIVEASFADPERFAAAVAQHPLDARHPLLVRALGRRLSQEPDWSDRGREMIEALVAPMGTASRSGLDEGAAAGTREPLTRREREVALVAATLPNREIAVRLGVSVRTVESHVRNAMKKCGTNRRTVLTEVASRG